ncbi:MAG: GNAT family N-acetyltransferase [Acidimicrobiales bacterium]
MCETVVEGASSMGRAATTDDLPAVGACLTSAFYDDPLWGLWTFPDRMSRTERLYELMHFWALAAVRHSWVRMSENAETVAVWLPPGEPEMTTEEETLFGQLLINLLGQRADEANALFERFDEHHPREPHYYLSLWATHRNHAGRGLGSALVEDNLACIDVEHMPAYLESTNSANLPRYEALGFHRRDEFGPVDGPVITTMWREAR